jgi:NADP-dependent 3-hydroxy acid dehydrogenase YdfG
VGAAYEQVSENGAGSTIGGWHGASTGIGQATVLHLRQLGFTVLAGVRSDEDAERLRSRGVTPTRLEVTDHEQMPPPEAVANAGPIRCIEVCA